MCPKIKRKCLRQAKINALATRNALLGKQDEVCKNLDQIQMSRLQLLKPGLNLPDLWTPLTLEEEATCFKVVAAVAGGGLVSIFDGITEYHLGRWTVSRRGALGWPPLNACYYVYSTPQEAVAAAFPQGSALLGRPRILLQVLVKGRGYKHEGGKWAFGKVKVINLVSESIRGEPYAIAAKYMEDQPHPARTSRLATPNPP